jgi:hypothetical protein
LDLITAAALQTGLGGAWWKTPDWTQGVRAEGRERGAAREACSRDYCSGWVSQWLKMFVGLGGKGIEWSWGFSRNLRLNESTRNLITSKERE